MKLEPGGPPLSQAPAGGGGGVASALPFQSSFNLGLTAQQQKSRAKVWTLLQFVSTMTSPLLFHLFHTPDPLSAFCPVCVIHAAHCIPHLLFVYVCKNKGGATTQPGGGGWEAAAVRGELPHSLAVGGGKQLLLEVRHACIIFRARVIFITLDSCDVRF